VRLQNTAARLRQLSLACLAMPVSIAQRAGGPLDAVRGILPDIVAMLCRASFYINLLGLKIPAGLCLRASHACYVFGFILCAVVPFLGYCHIYLLPDVGQMAWHVLVAIWVTIPMFVVGAVIVAKVSAPKTHAIFVSGLIGAAFMHVYGIPALQPTWAGAVLLQIMFAVFEDGSVAGLIWCLHHVLRVQSYIRTQQAQGMKCPIAEPKSLKDHTLIIGNAPTVVGGDPLGPVIDSFSNVVRFNNYNLDRPEYTGTKATFHFCNGRNMPATNTVQAVLPLFNASLTHAMYLFLPHMEDASEICTLLMTSQASVWFVEEEPILKLCQKIRCNFWQIPSSGMIAIDAFLSKYPDVTLHGFNFFAGKKIHYFEESPLQLITSWLERFVTHNPACEKIWVESLLSEGRATFLAQGAVLADGNGAANQEGVEASKGKGKGDEKDGNTRLQLSSVWRFLSRDGMPSQFSM